MMNTSEIVNWNTMRDFRSVIRENKRISWNPLKTFNGSNLDIYNAGRHPAAIPVRIEKPVK